MVGPASLDEKYDPAHAAFTKDVESDHRSLTIIDDRTQLKRQLKNRHIAMIRCVSYRSNSSHTSAKEHRICFRGLQYRWYALFFNFTRRIILKIQMFRCHWHGFILGNCWCS